MASIADHYSVRAKKAEAAVSGTKPAVASVSSSVKTSVSSTVKTAVSSTAKTSKTPSASVSKRYHLPLPFLHVFFFDGTFEGGIRLLLLLLFLVLLVPRKQW